MLGYRLGVGLNYQASKAIELNLIGTWGKSRSQNDSSLFNWEDTSYYNDVQLTDYQLSFGLISKFGS